MLLISLILPTLLIVLLCLIFCLKRGKHGLGSCFLLGWTFLILLSLPAGIWQAIFGWPHIDITSSPLWLRLLIPLVGWSFNAGGYTIRLLFEATVGPLESLIGHRSATVMSNLPYFWFLVVIQVSIIALIFALRYRHCQKLVDWFSITLGLLFLVNSLINVRWFWAGT
jgi:hypothetical protein